MARLRIHLEWENEKTERESKTFEVFGSSPQDLAMLGAAKGYLEGLHMQAAKAAEANPFMGMMQQAMEILKPKEYPAFPLPPLPGGSLETWGRKGRVGTNVVITGKGEIEVIAPSLDLAEEAAKILEEHYQEATRSPGSTG